MRRYAAYLFDADGTLFDTREMIYRSFCAMAAAFGRPPPDRAFIDSLVGLPFPPQVERVLGPQSPEERARAIEGYRAHQVGLHDEWLRVFPGVVEGLAALRRGGAKLALVTSRSLASLPRFLPLLDGPAGPGTSLFDAVVTPESTARHKPDPAPVLHALGELDAAAGDAVMIGDAEFDVEAGTRAGVDTVLMAWGGMSPDRWAHRPTRVVHAFAELLPDPA